MTSEQQNMVSKALDYILASITAATVFQWFHWALGVPLAMYWTLRWWRLYKDKKARE
jgi:hypothetical protein